MRHVLAFVLAMAFGAFTATGSAHAASIEGSWSGSGTARPKSGEVVAIRCRVRYEKGTGRTFVLHLTCAHANGTFKVSGRIVKLSKSRYSGRLYSDQYDVSGDVTINASAKRQTLRAKSAKGTATIVFTKR